MATISRAATLPKPKSQLEIRELEIPALEQDQLLIKVNSIALNPLDWKMQDFGFLLDESMYPHVLGTDISGVIIAKGESRETSGFNIGERVLGFANSVLRFGNGHGGFQTHSILRAISTTHVPSSLSNEAASALPMAVATAGLGIWRFLGLPRPATGQSIDTHVEEGVLIWGASSSVGAAAVQMVRLSGYSVYATASKTHADWLKRLGVREVVDYRDSDVTEQLLRVARRDNVKIIAALDAVSGESDVGHSSVLSAKIVSSSNGGGKIATTLPWPNDVQLPAGITNSQMAAATVGTTEKDTGRWLFNDWLEEVLRDGKFVPGVNTRVVGHELEMIQRGLEEMKKGVSGEKLIVALE